MKNRKDDVAAQRPPKQSGDQIACRPDPEKNKNDSASKRDEKVAPRVKQGEAEETSLRDKDVSEEKRWAEAQGLVTQETKSPGERRERQSDGRTRCPVRGRMEPARPGVNREKLRFESDENREGDVPLFDHEKFIGPREFHQDGAGGREQNQIIPAFAQRDGGNADVQHRDVTEERRRIIDAGRKQDRSEEAAEQAENDDHLRVHADGEEERGRSHDRHGGERGDEIDEVIENVGCENVAVENEHAGGAKTLAGDAVAP